MSPDSLSLTAYRKLTRQLIKKLLDVVFKTKVSINVDRFFPLKTERKGTRKVSLSAFEYRTVHSENCYYFNQHEYILDIWKSENICFVGVLVKLLAVRKEGTKQVGHLGYTDTLR